MTRSGCWAKAGPRGGSRLRFSLPFASSNRAVKREESRLAKRTLAAILMCAVMVLVAAVPLALAHEVIKGPQGPRASAITWEFDPPGLGVWSAKITNNGLRSLVIDVYDSTTGVPDGQNLHQRIRFAAYDAYPSGEVTSNTVTMSASHNYTVVATPNGPRGSSCTIDDMFREAVYPVAAFDAPIVGMTVTVDATDSYDPEGQTITYAWDFGDGAMGSDKVMPHTYLTPGEKTIVLTVTDTDGLTDSESKKVIAAEADVPPVARFTTSMNWMVVTVDASASTDANNNIVSLTWNWGDASPDETYDWATTKTATHTYATEGEKTITLTVTDSTVLSGTATAKVTADMAEPPVASFTASIPLMKVTVDASGSSDPNNDIVSLTWTWGDLSAPETYDWATTKTATHTYMTAGEKTITLLVKDSAGLTDDMQMVVKAKIAPTAGFTVSLIAYNAVKVDASTLSSDPDGTIVSYAWDFGDLGTASGPEPTATHTYAKAGTYHITLVVKDNDDLTATAANDATLVDNGPTASFLISVSGLRVNVDAKGSSDDWGIASFTWNWNDGSPLETYLWPTTTAYHDYAVPTAASAPMSSTGRQPPGSPYPIAGYCYDGDTTTKLAGCSVVVTDVTKGVSSPVLTSSATGYYSTDLGSWAAWSLGDEIKVTATLGDKYGEKTGYVAGTGLALIVRLYGTGPPPFEVTITLTVTDTWGQTATVSQKVMLTPP